MSRMAKNTISKLLYRFLLPATILLLVSCGPGGNGSQPDQLSVSTNNLKFGARTGYPANQNVTGYINNYSSSVWLYILYTNNGISSVSTPVISGNSGTSTVYPRSASVLGPGLYTDTIDVLACSDAGCGGQLRGSPQIINVDYTVGIFTAPSSLEFSAAAGETPAPQTVTLHLWDYGSWASSYLYTSGSGWLSYDPPSGSATPATVTVSINPAPDGTPPGTVYEAEIRFGANAGADLFTLPVTYTIL